MVDKIIKDFGSLTLADLYKCENSLKDIIKHKKNEHRAYTTSLNIMDYVECCNDFVSETDFNVVDLTSELESLKSQVRESTSSGVQNLWLSTEDRPYSWKSKSGMVTNPPINITEFHEINTMLDKLNKDLDLNLNSCLFSYYKNGKACARLHNDDEPEMDINQPICVVSFGACRKVDFLNIYQASTERSLLTLEPKDGTLYIMKQMCQEFFKHRVMKNVNITEERYSLSFRRIIPLNEEQPALATPSPVKHTVEKFENLSNNNDTLRSVSSPIQHNNKDVIKPKVTSPPPPTPLPKSYTKTAVIFGTSITLPIVGKLLGRDGRNVINCSKSGAKIHDIHEMVENFYYNHGKIVDVDKIIFSFGTNDVRFQTKNFYHKFYDKIDDLIEKTKCFFPKAIIFFQTVLPIRIVNGYTAQNILEFNRLLVDICTKWGCPLIDCFRDFVSPDGFDFNRMWFKDDLHLNTRGVGLLCRWFKYVINRAVFNPFIL